jgi:hypothetical protein
MQTCKIAIAAIFLLSLRDSTLKERVSVLLCHAPGCLAKGDRQGFFESQHNDDFSKKAEYLREITPH